MFAHNAVVIRYVAHVSNISLGFPYSLPIPLLLGSYNARRQKKRCAGRRNLLLFWPDCDASARFRIERRLAAALQYTPRMNIPGTLDWNTTKTRCPTCRKLTPTVLGHLLNEHPPDWDNLMGRKRSVCLVREGICPWCGKRTTTPAKTLLGRFEPTLMSFMRAGLDITR